MPCRLYFLLYTKSIVDFIFVTAAPRAVGSKQSAFSQEKRMKFDALVLRLISIFMICYMIPVGGHHVWLILEVFDERAQFSSNLWKPIADIINSFDRNHDRVYVCKGMDAKTSFVIKQKISSVKIGTLAVEVRDSINCIKITADVDNNWETVSNMIGKEAQSPYAVQENVDNIVIGKKHKNFYLLF